jgi:hypothetical protein
MVVIDQANLHLRCDSERQFETLVEALVQTAQQCEVAIVLTMQPDAFRNGEGVAKYLQSRSLKENAHSVWRLATPTDPEVPSRVLEIVKTCHDSGDPDRPAWHLTRGSDQRLASSEATGTELAPTKDLLKHRHLVRVLEYVDQILLVLGGMAVWKVRAERAAQHGIQPRQLRDAPNKRPPGPSCSETAPRSSATSPPAWLRPRPQRPRHLPHPPRKPVRNRRFPRPHPLRFPGRPQEAPALLNQRTWPRRLGWMSRPEREKPPRATA